MRISEYVQAVYDDLSAAYVDPDNPSHIRFRIRSSFSPVPTDEPRAVDITIFSRQPVTDKAAPKMQLTPAIYIFHYDKAVTVPDQHNPLIGAPEETRSADALNSPFFRAMDDAVALEAYLMRKRRFTSASGETSTQVTNVRMEFFELQDGALQTRILWDDTILVSPEMRDSHYTPRRLPYEADPDAPPIVGGDVIVTPHLETR